MSEIIGAAGDFNGDNVLTRSDAAALSGLANFTIRCLILPDVSMIGSNHGWFCVNTPTGADGPAALTLLYIDNSLGVPDLIRAKIRTPSGNAFVTSTGNKHAAVRQMIHAVFTNGAAPKLYLDGVDVSSSDAAVQTGGILIGSGGIFIGAGARDTPGGGWVGSVDELSILASSFSAARCAAEARSWNSPSRFYAVGGENIAGDTNLAPIAPPMEVAASTGVQSSDVDVVANGIDPGGGALTIAGSPTSDNGTVSVVAGKLRGTVASDGLATWSYNLQEPGGKMATGHVFVTSTPAVTPGGEYPPLTGTLRTVNTVGELATKYALAQPGDHIVIANGLVFTAPFNFNRPGTAGQPIVVRAANNPGGSSPEFRAGATMSAIGNMWWGLRFFGSAGVSIGTGATFCRIRRCLIYDQTSPLKTDTGIAVAMNANDCIVEYLEMHHCWGRGIRIHRNTKRNKILHVYQHDFLSHDVNAGEGAGLEPLRFGDSTQDYNKITSTADRHEIAYIYAENINQFDNHEDENPSIKLPFTYMHHLHLKNAGSPTFRHTRDSRLDLSRIEGGDVIVAGARNVLNSVWITGGTHRIATGNWDSNQSGTAPDGPPSPHPTAYQSRLHGCKGSVLVGYNLGSIPSAGTRIIDHISGSITGPDPYTTTPQPGDEAVLGTPPTYTAASQGWMADL